MTGGRLDWRGVEFAVLHFDFEFGQNTTLTLANLLQLRRELHRSARVLFALEGSEAMARARFAALFDPPLPEDPVARRRYQRPGPPFVLAVDPESARDYAAGDQWSLRVLFLGQGAQSAADLARVFQALARSGFGPGVESSELVAIQSEDPSGRRALLWREGEPLQQLTPVFCELAWWLTHWPPAQNWRLECLTPARILSGGRPLFRPTLDKLFPFILRRVTSMVHAHCGLELLGDPQPLLQAAGAVLEQENTLAWSDWRALEREDERFELGGLMGGMSLTGASLEEILPVLQVGSLLHLGKGAAFGTGHYRLTPRELGRES